MPQQPNQTLIKKLKELGLDLPSLPTPTGNYASYMLVPPYLYLSGVTPKENGKLLYKGKVGIEVTQKEAYLAVGVASLPGGAPVEVEMIVKVK